MYPRQNQQKLWTADYTILRNILRDLENSQKKRTQYELDLSSL